MKAIALVDLYSFFYKIISYNVTYVEYPIFYMHYGRKNYEV